MSHYHQSPIGYVRHVELKVLDLTVSIPFYTEKLGFSVLERTDDSVRLGTADGFPILTLRQLQNGTRKPPRTAGLYHVAILVPSRADLGQLLIHLVQRKVPLQGASDHMISEAIYLADPDGNGIELAADTNPSEWPWVKGQLDILSGNGPMDIDAVIAEAKPQPFTGLPSGTVLGHLHLHASQLEPMRRFYTEGLGMDVVITLPGSAIFMSYGQYHHHLAANVWNGVGARPEPATSAGLSYAEIALPSELSLATVAQRLRSLNAPVEETPSEIWSTDPSGNRIHIVA
jgi:catechol 2,3-dioxygenase